MLTLVAAMVDLSQTGSQESTHGSAQRRRTIEKTDPIQDLVSLVKECQVDDHAAQQATLAHAKKEASSNETPKGLGEAQTCADDSPSDDERWEVVSCLQSFHDPIARHVDHDVGNIEHDEGDVVLIPGELQVLGQPLDLGIAYVTPINESKQPGGNVSNMSRYGLRKRIYQIPKSQGRI